MVHYLLNVCSDFVAYFLNKQLTDLVFFYSLLNLFFSGGTQCTPVRQKMKTMSRSLQMLNFARLNVKAQKTQPDSNSARSAIGAEKGGKRCSGDRTKPGLMCE